MMYGRIGTRLSDIYFGNPAAKMPQSSLDGVYYSKSIANKLILIPPIIHI